MDFAWPHNLLPDEAEWRLVDFTGTFANPFGGGIRTVSRGQRWACTMRFLDVGGRESAEMAQRSQLLALVAALRGRSNRIWLSDLSSPFLGALECPELITTPFPVDAVSSWTSSNAEMVLRADRHNGLRLFRTGVIAARSARHSVVTTVSSARYACRALYAAGRGSVLSALNFGTSAGGTEIAAGTTRTTSGRYVESLATAGTSLHLSVYDDVSGRSAGDFYHVTGVSLSRCGRVSTTAAAQATAMLIKDLPASTAALGLAGDLFEVGGELHRLTANLDADGSGVGYALFEPALRAQQAADVPVIFRDPMGRFALAEEAAWVTRPGLLSDISLTFVEA